MARVILSVLVVVTGLVFTAVPEQNRASQASRPNILLIQADDLGYGDLSAYGQVQFTTPNLERMARDGIRFTNYYAGSTVCAPSRAALMTGLHTGHAWIRGNGDIPLRDEDVTVAMLLREAGYRTAVIGKYGLGGPGTSGQPDRKGFDTPSASSIIVTRTGSTPITSIGTASVLKLMGNATMSTTCSPLRPKHSSRAVTRDRSSCT